MRKHRRMFWFVGSVVCSLFLLGTTLPGSTAEQGSAGTKESAGMKKDKSTKPHPKDCDEGAPCAVNNPPLPGDKASDGSSCATGIACKVPGAGCGFMNRGKCKTIPMGGGQCSCACAM